MVVGAGDGARVPAGFTVDDAVDALPGVRGELPSDFGAHSPFDGFGDGLVAGGVGAQPDQERASERGGEHDDDPHVVLLCASSRRPIHSLTVAVTPSPQAA